MKTKKDIAAEVAKATGLSPKDAAGAVDATFAAVVTLANTEDRIQIREFGTFSVKHRPATVGRHPRTGEQINIAPSKRLGFKASKSA